MEVSFDPEEEALRCLRYGVRCRFLGAFRPGVVTIITLYKLFPSSFSFILSKEGYQEQEPTRYDPQQRSRTTEAEIVIPARVSWPVARGDRSCACAFCRFCRRAFFFFQRLIVKGQLSMVRCTACSWCLMKNSQGGESGLAEKGGDKKKKKKSGIYWQMNAQ